MRLERRIREGAERNAAVFEPNVEGSLSTVVRQARRRRRVRLTLSSLVTISLVATAIVIRAGDTGRARQFSGPNDGRRSRRRSRRGPPAKVAVTPATFAKTHLARAGRGPRERSGGHVEHRHRRRRPDAAARTRGVRRSTGSWPLDHVPTSSAPPRSGTVCVPVSVPGCTAGRASRATSSWIWFVTTAMPGSGSSRPVRGCSPDLPVNPGRPSTLYPIRERHPALSAERHRGAKDRPERRSACGIASSS